jgi:hypothetical protein
MSAGNGPSRPTGVPVDAHRWRAGLRTPPIDRFPYRRRIRIASAELARVVEGIARTLRRIRFDVEVRRGTPLADGVVPAVIVAERNLVPVPMSLARAMPLLALLAAGAVLGIVDYFVTNNLLFLFPWIAAFGIAALIFRLRIGGAYLSELILVEVRPMPATTPGVGPSVGTQWGAGRARSEGEMGPEHERTVVRIDPMIPLADHIAFVVQETSRELAGGPTVRPAASQSM